MKSLLTQFSAGGSLIIVMLFTLFEAQGQQRAMVSVAAASDLVFCLEELNAQFQKAHSNITINVTSGSSGNFFAQIRRDAPFDVFLSADRRYPEELVRAGKADGGTLYLYAVGRIVLWTTRTNLAVTNGLSILTNPSVRKIAIANPEHAPYGQAAKAALERAGVWAGVQHKLVIGENIAQTAQFVQTGNVDAGIVALSLVSAPRLKNTGSWWLIPEDAHPRLEQAAVRTRHGTGNAAAGVYLDFLRSEAGRAILHRFGFGLPAR